MSQGSLFDQSLAVDIPLKEVKADDQHLNLHPVIELPKDVEFIPPPPNEEYECFLADLRMKIQVMCGVLKEGIENPNEHWKSKAAGWIEHMKKMGF